MRSRVSTITGVNLQHKWSVDELKAINIGTAIVFEHDASRIPELRAAIPDIRVCLRMFGDPTDSKRLAATAYSLAAAYLRPGDYLCPGNEFNLEFPSWSIEEIAYYAQSFVTHWRQWFPALGVKLVSPALSPSAPNGDAHDRLQLAWLHYDLIGVHAYRGADHHVGSVRAVWPSKPVFVTEYGTDNPAHAASYADAFANRCAALGYVEGCAWFLWDCPADKEWRAWRARGTPTAQALSYIGHYEAPPNGGASDLENPMPADGRVEQPLGEPSCLVAASMACLEVMADIEVTESVSVVYAEAVDAGLYAATPDVPQQILDIMAYVGNRGVTAEGGRINGSAPYRVTVAEMLDALTAGLRPFVLWYPLAGGVSHAVCAKAVRGNDLIVADQTSTLPDAGDIMMSVDWIRANGYGAFAYSAHTFVADAPAPYVPDGVEVDAFGAWREACKVNRTDYTSTQAFLDHLAALGADWSDPHRYGYPRHAPIAPTPTPPRQIATRFGPVTEPANSAIMAVWPADLWVRAAEVSYLESGWNPAALADTVSRVGPCGTPYLLADGRRAVSELSAGLFQVNICAHGGTVAELSDPLANARKGYEIYTRQGWAAWLLSAERLGLL